MRTVAFRLLHLACVVLVVTFSVTALLALAPGDVVYQILGDEATPKQIAQLRHALHLDEPLLSRYWRWLASALHGDLGRSALSGQPVTDAIVQRLPVTAELLTLALMIALAISIPLGILSGYRAHRPIDRITSVVTSTLIATPAFVVALLLVYVFSIKASGRFQLPATGWTDLSADLPDNLRHAVLPSVALAAGEIPVFTSVLRNDVMLTLGEDFVAAARGRGLSTIRILLRHTLRPSSIGLVTFSGLSAGRLIGGAAVLETLFALPGVGQLLVVSIQGKDTAVVQGVVAFIALAYVLINLAVDGLCAVLDPRLRTVIA